MNKRIMILSTTVVLLTIVQPAMAANLWCNGNIKKIYVDTGGRTYVYSTWRSNYTMICDLNTTWNGVSTDVCKHWFSMLQGAYHAQTPVTIFYSGISGLTCADLPTYTTSPGPGYVMNNE